MGHLEAKWINYSHASRLIALLALLLGLSACSGNIRQARPYQEATTDVNHTRLAKILAPTVQAQPRNQGGFMLIQNGMDALRAIIYLSNTAEKSLDLQYWSFHQDKTGKLVLYHLLKAADRGVKVRLLLDDFFASGGNANFNTLAKHPNIEVRLYNPVSRRKWLRSLSMLLNFNKANRRMHNKVFIADNKVAIVGGRNIGDAYYMAKRRFFYRDLDLMMIGSVVQQVSSSFDAYWNAKWAVNIRKVNKRLLLPIAYADTRSRLTQHYKTIRSSRYWQVLQRGDIAKKLSQARQYFVWARYKVLYDPPSKVRSLRKRNKNYIEYAMTRHMMQANSSIRILTPYFIPQRSGMRWIKKMRKKGINVAVLTNSFAANDFSLSHGGYQRYRIALLKAGVQLYEFRRGGVRTTKRNITWFKKKPLSYLHAKSIIIDDRYIYVGSVNYTPRSSYLNTEISIMVDSTILASQLRQTFAKLTTRQNSYSLRLKKVKSWPDDEAGEGEEQTQYQIVWNASKRTVDPGVGLLKHLSISLISLLPIENML